MDWPDCIRCHGTRVVPGTFSDEQAAFRIDASIAGRRSWFGANHELPLDELAWLCIECGLAWQEANRDFLRGALPTLRAKCRPEFQDRLFGE